MVQLTFGKTPKRGHISANADNHLLDRTFSNDMSVVRIQRIQKTLSIPRQRQARNCDNPETRTSKAALLLVPRYYKDQSVGEMMACFLSWACRLRPVDKFHLMTFLLC